MLADLPRFARTMQILKTLAPSWVAPVLAAGVTLAVGVARLPAQEDQRQTEQIQKRIDRLIEQLGHEDYLVRQQAEAELAEFSFEAFDALSAATTHEDLEIAARARHLLRLMRVQWTNESDPPEVRKLLGGYELFNGATRLSRMRSLAGLAEGKGIPALCRLVRYEKSPVLSKQAATELLGSQPADEPPAKELAELLRKNLGPSRRTAATWLLTWVLDLETGDPQTLAELLGWLIEQQAWESVGKLADRFPAQFARNPVLLYTVAQAQAEKGNDDQAEQTVQRALGLNPGNGLQQLIQHYLAARALWQRGLLKWAQREYRHIIDTGTPNNDVVIAAYSLLAEMLHDQRKELEAAKVLEALVQAAGKQANLPAAIRDRLPAIRSRMDYFFACHFQSRNDRAKQREYLDKAVAADPTDADVLIARYRLPDQTAEYRSETLKLIKQAAAKFRQEIAHAPDNGTPYNQFAWLVANTEGDLDRALEYCRKSIQLSPTSGGLYDTLAHVYYARGDYENAVKTQTKAAQMEPHTKAITRQLEVFRKKWEETKKEGKAPGKPDG